MCSKDRKVSEGWGGGGGGGRGEKSVEERVADRLREKHDCFLFFLSLLSLARAD